MAVHTSAMAAGPPSVPGWPTATELALMSGAPTGTAQSVQVNSVSCPETGNCVAVGTFTDGSATTQMMYAIERNGVWNSINEVTPPSNAIAGPRSLSSVSCTGVGYCQAVGYYKDNESGDLLRGLLMTEAGGVWGPAVQSRTYPNEDVTYPGDGLGSISCSSAGNCLAGGFYNDTTSSGQPMVISETDGSWGTPVELSQPAGSFGVPGALGVHTACAAQGDCVAAAAYLLSEGPVDYRAMVATETNGVWGAALELTLPTNANTVIGQQVVHVSDVACSSPGNCVVTGDFLAGQQSFPFADTETAGTWHQAVQVRLPVDAATQTTNNGQKDSIASVWCANSTNCNAVGWYVYTSATCAYCTRAFTLNEVNGAWGVPSALPLPNNALSTNESSSLTSIDCAAPSVCTVAGRFANAYDSGTLRTGYGAMVTTSLASQSLTMMVGTKRFTLTAPITKVTHCVNRASALPVSLTTSATKGDVTVRSVTVYVGKRRTVVHQLPATEELSIAGEGKGVQTLSLVISYRHSVRKLHRTLKVTSTKSLITKFAVC